MKDHNLASEAIQAAIDADWQKAILLNKEIIKTSPDDEEALLRLAKAYETTCQLKKAKTAYNKVKKINRFNPIAKRGLARLKTATNNKDKINNQKTKIKGDLFLEEPGKTKTISLVNIANQQILMKLEPAQEVRLLAAKRCISVRDGQNHYLGKLPDDLSQRLIKLIKRGNQYQAVVKEVEPKKIIIYIKETKRSKKNIDIPSFLAPGEHYHTFLPKELLNNKD